MSPFALAAAFLGASPALATPPLAPQTDDGRAALIRCFLENSPKMEGASFTVTVSDHIAVVSASVLTLDQAEWLSATLHATDEVYGAIQQISFRRPGLETEEIVDDADHRLRHASVMAGSALSADLAADGQLVLTGEATSIDQIGAARELMSRVEGVRKISSEAAVNPLAPVDSDTVEAILALRLVEDPLLCRLPIRFDFDDGLLTISGRVPSRDLKERLVMNSMVGGVMACDSDQLEIDPSLAIHGMSEKRLFPEDAFHIAGLLAERDPRIPEDRIVLGLDQGRLMIRAEQLSQIAAEALNQNLSGLPGLSGIDHLYRILPDSTISRRSTD